MMNKSKKSKTNIKSLPDIGGYDPTNPRWPIGSLFANEGQRLYELVLAIKPKIVVEIGAHYGCSATWICTALRELKSGILYSIDINEGSHSMFPKDLNRYIKIIHGDCFKVDPPENIDLLFEDGEHTTGFSRKVFERYPAKVVAVHDYMHWDCQNTVRKDFNEFFGEPDEVFFEPPSDCGLAIKF